MIRALLSLTLMTLLLTFSFSVKAIDANHNHGSIKNALVESSSEFTSSEITPDIEHFVVSKEFEALTELNKSFTEFNDTENVSISFKQVTCRGPPLKIDLANF